MSISSVRRPVGRPVVHVCEDDYERLCTLAETSPHLPGAALLQEELERAVVTPARRMPANAVRLGALVTYEDIESGVRRQVRVVLPKDADIDDNRISVLTPVGAALLGVHRGAAISWMAGGRKRRLRVIEVEDEHVGA